MQTQTELLEKTTSCFHETSMEVSELLVDVVTCHREQLAEILHTYGEVIRPTFIPLLVNVWLLAKSPVAKKACQENLLCEIGEDHPAMLDRFLQPLVLHAADAKRTEQAKKQMQMILQYAARSPLYGVTVLALLEHTSAAFMPWLEAATQRLGHTDLTYIQKHGVADIQHADDFTKAVVSEVLQLNVTGDFLTQPKKDVLQLLRYIFA